MESSILRGFVLALFGAVTIFLGDLLSLELDQVALLGIALGAVIALVPDSTLARRIAGFAIGFVLAWVGYGFRAAVLPDAAIGRATVVFAVVAISVVIAVAIRVPFWSLLVGSAAIVGAYEQTYAASPSLFTTDSPDAATTVLLACAMGVLGATVVGGFSTTERRDEDERIEVGA